jgi:hypothetical protein
MDTRIVKLFILTLTLATLAACGNTTGAGSVPTTAPTLPPPAVVISEPTAAPTAAVTPGAITGHVHLMAPPTPAMVVYALDPATGQWAFTKTQAADGEAAYTITVPPGTYQVFAAADAGKAVDLGYWQEADAWTLATVAVAAGQTVSGIDVRPPSQSKCGSMLGFPASPDGRFAAVAGPTQACRDSVTKAASTGSATPAAQTPPMRIQFAAGATSVKITGGFGVNSGADLPDTYVLGAAASQAMTVNLASIAGGQPVPGGAYLHVWGADGVELASVDPQVATWQGALPSTQDYYIGVIFAAKTPIEYTLDVAILPAGQAAGPVLPKVVPVEFNLFLQTLTDTDVPLVLPPSFPVEAGQPAIYPAVTTSDTGEYELSLDYGPNCHGAGACHYGSLSGKKVSGSEPVGTTNSPFDASQAQKVTLAQGIQGYLIPFTCGASCGDTQVYWIVNGYQYMLGLKGGAKTAVINLANAAIQNSSPKTP